MSSSKLTAAAAAIALVGSGLLAGSVIGGDGSGPAADRIPPAFGAPIEQRAEIDLPAPGRALAKSKRTKKPRVVHGSGRPIEVAAGAASSVALRCPKRYPVPVSAGLATDAPGIFPGEIGRFFESPRAMLVAVVNRSERDGSWAATIVCMKGVKEDTG